MIIVIIVCVCILAYVIWQKIELGKFNVTKYEVQSAKLKEKLSLVLVSDLHSHIYGEQNDVLFDAVKKENPDLILIPGDMMVGKKTESYETAYEAFRELVKIAPVYFSYGNHEGRPIHKELSYSREYLAYEKRVRDLGVHFLNNDSEKLIVKGNEICLHGVDIDLKYYTKGKKIPMEKNYLQRMLREPNEENYHILLAHNPSFAREYVSWGADLTVCGHTHGGLVRVPGVGSVISPQFQLFPKYDAGKYEFGDKNVIVSKGLGTHTFHIRIFDRAELVVIQAMPKIEN